MILKEERNILKITWKEAWMSPVYRAKLIAGWIFYIAVLLYLPHFFAAIQKKQGVLLDDIVLASLPSINMSFVIFTLLYITIIFTIYRAAKSPYLFLLYLWATLFVSLSRLITNGSVALEPPIGLVSLVDPILLPFYGPNGITKDLFYSGHTASVFLAYLILQKKKEKIAALIATIIVGIALLLQHIHYTIDVLAAPIIVYVLYILAKKFTLVPIAQKIQSNVKLKSLKRTEKVV
jgi:membrane-associated phospholipid phosphatase